MYFNHSLLSVLLKSLVRIFSRINFKILIHVFIKNKLTLQNTPVFIFKFICVCYNSYGVLVTSLPRVFNEYFVEGQLNGKVDSSTLVSFICFLITSAYHPENCSFLRLSCHRGLLGRMPLLNPTLGTFERLM